MEERGGLVTEEDLATYEARWDDPVEVEFRGFRVRTRAGLSDFPRPCSRLAELAGSRSPSGRSHSSARSWTKGSPRPARRTSPLSTARATPVS